MKICFYAATAGPLDILSGRATDRGGAEKQIAQLMQALAALGHQIYFLYSDGSALEPNRTVAGIDYRQVHLSWRRPGSLLALWRALRQIKPDFLYARLPDDYLWLLGLFCRLHADSNFVYALAHDGHCNPWRTYDYRPWFHNPLYALGLSLADCVLIQHPAQQPLVQPHVRGEIVQIPNLIQNIAATPRELAATTLDAIWVAQIRPAKQLSLFLALAERLPELCFGLVGGFDPETDEQTQSALRQQIAHLPNLTQFGLRTPQATLQLIMQSKVLVNTSRQEGFPNTMLEAWSVGVPVVSLTVDPGGVIERESLGFVSGTVERMAEDLAQLVASPALNQALGEHGLDYVRKNHSLQRVCAAFEAMMANVSQRARAKEGR